MSQATYLKAGIAGEPMLVDSSGNRQEFQSASVLKAGPGGVPVCETNVKDKGNVLVADQYGRPHLVDRQQATGEAPKPAEPVTEQIVSEVTDNLVDRNDRLIEALKSLDQDNDEHWTKDGKPRTDVISKIVGSKVSRKELESLVLPELSEADDDDAPNN